MQSQVKIGRTWWSWMMRSLRNTQMFADDAREWVSSKQENEVEVIERHQNDLSLSQIDPSVLRELPSDVQVCLCSISFLSSARNRLCLIWGRRSKVVLLSNRFKFLHQCLAQVQRNQSHQKHPKAKVFLCLESLFKHQPGGEGEGEEEDVCQLVFFLSCWWFRWTKVGVAWF